MPETRSGWGHHLGARAATFDPASLVEAASLPRVWHRRWAADPGRRVLFAATEKRWITGGELEARTGERALTLARLGVVPGDRVLYCIEAPIPLIEWHIATFRLGAVAVPTNPAYRERELSHIAADSSPVVAIVDGHDRRSWVANAVPTCTMLAADGPAAAPTGVDVALDEAVAGMPALLPYTSGTTGVPKGAPLTHGNLLASVMALIESWRWSPNDVLVLALPLFHMHGLGVGLHGTLATGAAAVVQPSFDAPTVLDAIDEHDATLFFGVPTMYARLGGAGDASRLSRLRLCVSGSAPLAAELFHRIEEVSGQRVLERYGMTETVMNLSNPYDGERRPGTVGFELPGVEARLSQGTTGEIELRGPNVFAGYWQRPEATADAFTPDGWFKSGDIAELDGDGYHRIVGRAKELIISGGYNVYPREIEDALLEVPGIREAAVVGTQSAEWGEIVTAYVVRDDPRLDTATIDAFSADRLASYKRPRLVRFVDELPRNALGKVLRDQLS